ncbi:hypothetical protein CPB83DRAFT_848234, partial [Crepidotus variabilis]
MLITNHHLRIRIRPSTCLYHLGMRIKAQIMSSTKFPISALPLAQKSQLLIHNLTPDSHTPSAEVFRTKVLKETPSIQRRARLLAGPSHFSYATPFPTEFPYDIEAPVPTPQDNPGGYIEEWLTSGEPLNPLPAPKGHPGAPLRKYIAKTRDQPLDLIGISETALRDCVPHLEVGDAFAILGTPTLSDEFGEDTDPIPSDIPNVVEARQDLIDVLGGRSTLMSPPEEDSSPNTVPFAPWSLRYSGHQFGSWAGQLGDGRAISVLVTPHPKDPGTSYELQLKGSGRTPFSRTADGLAVLRSSIREYLCSEAMEALKIPTTRALTLISLPALSVNRERVETACILTRMAPSFIRIGCFEALNGPTNMFFFGGGQQKPDYEGLRVLGEWVAKGVLKLEGAESGNAWGKELVLEVARRNAKMVAGWQAYGFMHGVMNTDNISVLGLTIDYGPYAFMDVFDAGHVCNHTDETGRYAYKFQPNMIIYALRALLNSLAPLIGAEAELNGKAVSEGWAKDATEEKIKEWTAKGKDLTDVLEKVAQEIAAEEYGKLMRKRLGLRRQDSKDEVIITRPLLELLEQYKVDFHSTLRSLSYFQPSLVESADLTKPSSNLNTFLEKILNVSPDSKANKQEAKEDLTKWLQVYAKRLESEKEEWSGVENIQETRQEEMLNVNPRFILRQWVLEEVIKRVERDADSGKRVLAKVMHMACNPFLPWGGED